MFDESQWIARAQTGDHEAFMALVKQYDHRVMAVVYRFTCDQFDRDDLYQEVFMAAFRHIKKFRQDSSFSTWLYRIALNRCMDQERKRKWPTSDQEPSESVDWEQRQKLKAIHLAIKRLPKKSRICFHLHYIEGFNIDEIADILPARPGTVKSHLHRARCSIRKDQEVLAWIQQEN